MSRLLLPLLMAWLFVCLCPGPSIAGDGGEEEVLFYGEDAVKTPSFRVQPLEESPSPVTIITAQDIRNSGALTLPEVLALAPGVDTLRRSESNVEVSIRGFNSYSSNKVLVMLDSRPLFNLADASVNWNLIPVPIDEIERVEIVRGPGSALYGENAFFGIINIITKAPRAGSAKGSARVSGGAGTGESTSAKARGIVPFGASVRGTPGTRPLLR